MISDSQQAGRPENSATAKAAWFAIRLSLGIGLCMLIMKTYAYYITGSAAILSDAAESVVHNVAVMFAAYSLRLSLKPPDSGHPYGHDRVSFFSAGFEGMMIVLAAVYIIYESIHKWMVGLSIENLNSGIWFVTVATVVNGLLGWYLVHRGRKFHMIVLEANGKHVLTDSWTSLGVIVGLLLTKLTGWLPFDPIVAILVGTNILFSGGRLMRRSIGGLMDESDPDIHASLEKILTDGDKRYGVRHHDLRHRNTGNKLFIEFHVLFKNDVALADAHEIATTLEEDIRAAFPYPVEVLTHLEPQQSHHNEHVGLSS